MAFQGWLLKVGDTDISKYVDIENYKVARNREQTWILTEMD